MADFHQGGTLATLHDLNVRSLEDLERTLCDHNQNRPLSLLIPTLYSELDGPALSHIVDEIAQIPYLSSVVIGLDQANEAEFHSAKAFFSRLPQPVHILWNDGPRLRAIHDQLIAAGLAPNQPGKGRNVWYCLGYISTTGLAEVVAIHDADILTYDRSLPARLLYPISAPDFGFRFCKGYYPRVAGDRLGGRVSRLFFTPLIRSLVQILGPTDYLEFLDAFRYPLSGEFALHVDEIAQLRIPPDWGLEVGLLSEIYRNLNRRQVCQVDIAARYDHKHQPMSEEDASQGLARMSREIAVSVFRKLATQGVVLAPETFRTLKAAYLRTALDLVQRYQADAKLNGLSFNCHAEEAAVETFTRAVIEAGDTFLASPFEPPYIPSWGRVTSAYPEIPLALARAVAKDNEQSASQAG